MWQESAPSCFAASKTCKITCAARCLFWYVAWDAIISTWANWNTCRHSSSAVKVDLAQKRHTHTALKSEHIELRIFVCWQCFDLWSRSGKALLGIGKGCDLTGQKYRWLLNIVFKPHPILVETYRSTHFLTVNHMSEIPTTTEHV